MPHATEEGRKAWAREYYGNQRAAGREKTEPPDPTDPEKRSACDARLYTFGLTCFPDIFFLPPSPSHADLADAIQSAIHHGTKRAIAVQRGFGKTAWCFVGVIWATLTKRCEMVMLISNNQQEADELRDDMVAQLETNQHLYGLYPELVHFFRETSADGPQMKSTFRGEQLRLERRPDIVFPSVPFRGAEACLRFTGIDSRGIRGAHHVRTDGRWSRPTVVLLDDPQDDDLARSSTQVSKRVGRIRKTVHGLKPPGQALSVLMPCTPIERGDLAETFLDASKSPEYQGLKWPALDAFPECFEDTKNNLWQKYFDTLAEDFAEGRDEHPTATQFYRDNHVSMSRGAKVRWESRVDPNCIDALQTLMNSYAESRSSFMSEYQMQPEDADATSQYLSDDEIAQRFNRLRRRQVPANTDICTAAIDIQKRLLYWKILCWSRDRTGVIVDYGTFPPQPRPQFTHTDAPNTMERYVRKNISENATWEESLKHCLRRLAEHLQTPLETPNGELTPQIIMADNRWAETRTPVEDVSMESEYNHILQPCGGLYIGGGDELISARKMPRGARRYGTDVEWYIKKAPKHPPTVYFDANYYRSAFHRGLAAEPGNPGAITFFGRVANNVLADHYGAKQVRVKPGRKRDFEEWTAKPGRSQDHWLDCAVMCRVGLEVLGYRPGREAGKIAGRPSGGGSETGEKITAADVKSAKARASRR